MEYKLIGRTGVKVSALCFGTMSFGGDADEAESGKMFRRCREAGVNFFDCANMYQDGLAEQILGRLIAGSRNELVITSKAFFPAGADVNARGASRRHLRMAVEDSLRRLGTDRLDFYFIHHFDELTPLEETVRVLDDLVRQGKVLYPAVSNFAAWQVEKALGIAERRAWARFECLQPMYSLISRQAEVELLPMAQAEGLGVISYSPLAGGLLTGKYKPGVKPDAGRLSRNERYQNRYSGSDQFETAARFSAFAAGRGFDPASLAVAWVAGHPAITAPILGARNAAQLESSLRSVEIAMTPDLRAEISALSPEPPLATDRAEERVSQKFIGR